MTERTKKSPMGGTQRSDSMDTVDTFKSAKSSHSSTETSENNKQYFSNIRTDITSGEEVTSMKSSGAKSSSQNSSKRRPQFSQLAKQAREEPSKFAILPPPADTDRTRNRNSIHRMSIDRNSIHRNSIGGDPIKRTSRWKSPRLTAIAQMVRNINNKQKKQPKIMTPKMRIQQLLWSVDDEPRQRWPSQLYYLSVCIGSIVGGYDFIQAPAIVAESGGLGFFIAYFFCMIFFQFPLLIIELSLGQFSGKGPIGCFEFAPILKGLGFAMVITAFVPIIWSNVVNAWSLYIFFDIFDISQPWTTCGKSWNTGACIENFKQVDVCQNPNTTRSDGTCRDGSNRILNVYNYSLAAESKVTLAFPAKEYFYRKVIDYSSDVNPDNLGTVSNQLLIPCLISLWIIVCIVVMSSIKVLSRVLGVLFALKMLFLTSLVIKSTFVAETQKYSFNFYSTDRISELFTLHVWQRAVEYSFLSIPLGAGLMQTLASYNKFNGNVVTDAFILCLAMYLMTMIFCFTSFQYIDIIAATTGSTLASVLQVWQGLDLPFILCPMAIYIQGGTTFLNSTYFFFIIIFGIYRQIVMTKTVTVGIQEFFPRFCCVKVSSLILLCVVGFLLELSFITQGGLTLIRILLADGPDVKPWFLLLLEVISVSYVYGVHRFIYDLEYMVGETVFWGWVKFKTIRPVLAILWVFVVPLVLGVCYSVWLIDLAVKMVNYQFQYEQFVYQIFTFLMLLTFAVMAVLIYKNPRGSLKDKLSELSSPSVIWEPSDDKFVVGYNNDMRRKDIFKVFKSYFVRNESKSLPEPQTLTIDGDGRSKSATFRLKEEGTDHENDTDYQNT